MSDPATASMILGFVLGQVLNVIVGVVGARVDRHVVEPLVQRLSASDDVQRALRKAWCAACEELFGNYLRSESFQLLSPEEQSLVEAREDEFTDASTADALLDAGDPAAAFVVDRDVANRQLVDGIAQLGLWEGLPGDLQVILQQGLIDKLLSHFTEVTIKHQPEARDAIFFGQLVQLRQALGKTREEMETLWPRITLALQRMEEDQRRQSEIFDEVDARTIRIDRTTQQIADRISDIHDAQVQRPPLPSRPGPFGDLTGGLFGLPGSVATKMEAFLLEYLGTTAHPVPFGGREPQLDELDRWLGDRTRSLALIVAPGGRGKSALVCRWLKKGERGSRSSQ
jgi:hypothetical protein